jgi:2-oxoglutarate ferredoxin oxidoreductase subunit beta
VYHIEAEYNPEDRAEAFEKALQWGERIPVGILYRNIRPVYEERISVIKDMPLVRQPFDLSKIVAAFKEFY